jgi:hypothetical protein
VTAKRDDILCVCGECKSNMMQRVTKERLWRRIIEICLSHQSLRGYRLIATKHFDTKHRDR